MKPKEGMEVLIVKPENYDRIIELSKTTRFEPYTVEQLRKMEEQARSRNSVVTVMFSTPDYWRDAE